MAIAGYTLSVILTDEQNQRLIGKFESNDIVSSDPNSKVLELDGVQYRATIIPICKCGAHIEPLKFKEPSFNLEPRCLDCFDKLAMACFNRPLTVEDLDEEAPENKKYLVGAYLGTRTHK